MTIGEDAIWHGSAQNDLTELKPQASRVLGGQAAVFGTPNRDIALSFSRPWRDDDFDHGTVDGKPFMRERRPDAFSLLDGPGNLYQLPAEGFSQDPKLTKFERVNYKPVKPVGVERIKNVLQALRERRVFDLQRHPGSSNTKLAELLAHIAGPSGCGKTTVLKQIQKADPSIVAKDMDDFDDEARKALNLGTKPKDSMTATELGKLFGKQQKLLDAFLDKTKDPVILAGHHRHESHELKLDAPHKFLLDVDALTAAIRAYGRSKKTIAHADHVRTPDDLAKDIVKNQDTIDYLKGEGYVPTKPEALKAWAKLRTQ